MTYLRRSFALVVLVAVLLPVTIFQPYNNGPPLRSDGAGYHLWLHAFVQGRLTFEWYEGDRDAAGIIQVPGRPATWINKYPPGVGLIHALFMFAVVDREHPGHFTTAEHWLTLILAVVAVLLTAALMLAVARHLGVADRDANLAVLAVTFGTGLFHYATYDGSFSHVYSALGVALLVWFGVVRSRWPVLPTILTLALLILVRNTNVFFVLLWGMACGGYAYRTAGVWRRNAVTLGVGLLLGVGTQVLLNYHTQGRWTLSTYGGESFLWQRPMQLSVLASYERGLFLYYPLVAVILVVGVGVRRTRWATLAFAGVLAVYTVLYGYWHSWMLGGGFGHRGFVEFLPVAMPLFAVSLTHLGRRRNGVRALTGLCVLVTLCLMGGYWRGVVPDIGTSANIYWANAYRVDNLSRVWSYAKW